MDQRLFGLDAYRLLAMLGVVTLHTMPIDGAFGSLLRLYSIWGVPFFFMVSGFFLSGKTAADRTFPSITKTVVVFCVATLLLIPLTVYDQGLAGTFANVAGDQLLTRGSYFHLWFLSSMIIGLLFIAVSDSYRLRFFLPVVSVGVVLLYLLLGNYNPVSERYVAIARQFSSVAFMYLGMRLAGYEIKRSRAIALIVFGIALQLVEAWGLAKFLGKQHEDFALLLGTIPLVVGIFLVARTLPDSTILRRLAAFGSRYSLGIYIVHPYFIYSLRKIGERLTIVDSIPFRYGLSLGVFSLCLLTLWIIDQLFPVVIDLLAGDRRAFHRIGLSQV